MSETEPMGSKDISQEFLQSRKEGDGGRGWRQFLSTLKSHSELSITVDYTTLEDARALKAFLQLEPTGQKRTVAIRATKTQHEEAANEFTSGIAWIKVEG